jgi:hypothetical protein
MSKKREINRKSWTKKRLGKRNPNAGVWLVNGQQKIYAFLGLVF